MWWIFIIAIWLVLGVAGCRLIAIDWVLCFNDGVEWDHLWGIFLLCMLLPFIAPLLLLFDNSPHQKEIYKIFFGEIGNWFKDHIDWKW